MTTDQHTNTVTTCGLAWCLAPTHRHTDRCDQAALKLQLAVIRLQYIRRENSKGQAGGADLQRAEAEHPAALDEIADLAGVTLDG